MINGFCSISSSYPSLQNGQLNKNWHGTVNQSVYCFFIAQKKKERKTENEKILMAEEKIKQLQNKRKKLISQQKQEVRKKRDRRIYEKGTVFESIFTESKGL